MKYTLIQMTQEILSAMGGDEVSSITDTAEATQVAHCIRQAYYDLIEDLDPPELYSLFELTETDSGSPTLMSVPSDVNSLRWVKYNKIMSGETDPLFEEVKFLPFETFIDRMNRLNTDSSNISSYSVSIGSDTMLMKYYNDRSPTYYTTFGNDLQILFDSYDSDVDTYLTADKTEAYGRKAVTFALSDATTPTLDEPFFSRLLNEAKVLAFAELKSVDHALANRNARRSRNRVKAKYRIQIESDFDQLPSFGRR